MAGRGTGPTGNRPPPLPPKPNQPRTTTPPPNQPRPPQHTAGQPRQGPPPLYAGQKPRDITIPNAAPPGKPQKQPFGGALGGKKELFASAFGTKLVANKWQKMMSEDRQAKIIEMFTIPRDDPYDVYKPNSKVETQTTVELPYDKPLTAEAIKMLHEIAMHYDYGVQLDIIEAFQPSTFISYESQEQLGRLPTWLRFLLIYKYDIIHKKFGHHTHHFLKMLANYIDTKRSSLHSNMLPLSKQEPDEDFLDTFEIATRYELQEKDILQPRANVNTEGPIIEGEPITDKQKMILHKTKTLLNKDDLFKLKYALWKWKLPKTMEQDWTPQVIHRAATLLRRSLLAQPTAAEIAMVAEDEKALKKNASGAQHTFDDDDDIADVGENMMAITWEDIICDKVAYKAKIAAEVDIDLHRIPPGLSKRERDEELREAKEMQKDIAQKRNLFQKMKQTEVFMKRTEKKRRTVDLLERAPHRRYSRIWKKNCPQEPIKQAKRFPHHFRVDESFHAYVVSLVGSIYFKNFIMIIIILNAISLAVEISMTKEDYKVSYTFEILDNFFLSIYLVEFLLKFYAHPYRYWYSGFNVFDFVILTISLIKVILDWSNIKELSYLKLLVIFRALRILRGISMSVQIQVLISALVQTLRTHVISVLILLFLILYIEAISVYFLYADFPGLNYPWGNIFAGMLRLFTFVTMDGWTVTSEEFEKAGLIHEGRVLCIFGILLGNFFISNIFIAIIIMQISEATDAFRARERDEREEVISVKKEIVFRRQKLDMRQLLAKQSVSSNAHADFYYLGSQFLRLLRHDDLVDMNSVHFSPLWMDAFYKSVHRCHHTSNVIMNLHRQMADNLLEMYRKNVEGRYTVTPIRRSRYNRYMKLKSKLAILRQEFFRDNPSMVKVHRPLKVKLDKEEKKEPTAGTPTTTPTPTITPNTTTTPTNQKQVKPSDNSKVKSA